MRFGEFDPKPNLFISFSKLHTHVFDSTRSAHSKRFTAGSAEALGGLGSD